MEDKEKQPHWYAMKVFYNKVFEMEDLLEAYGIESYIAVTKEEQKGHAHSIAARRISGEKNRIDRRKFIQSGPMIYKRCPIVASLMFFHADADQLAFVRSRLYDVNLQKSSGLIYHDADNKATAIPDKQMEAFRLVTSMGGHVDVLDPIIQLGDRVRITEGPLAGTEGYVKRIGKDRRFLVCIEGVIAVATSYIPLRFMEKVEE